MLRSLFPESVYFLASYSLPNSAYLTADEQDAALRFSGRRRRDFIHGRYCARHALSQLGLTDQSIPIGGSREPIWPHKVVGSISHCDDMAIAAVAWQSELAGLGIDCEQLGRLDERAIKAVCNDDEIAFIQELDLGEKYYDVIFSAKESIYKCIWPTVKRYVDFLDISISLDINKQVFSISRETGGIGSNVAEQVQGRWVLSDEHVYCSALLARVINES